MKKKLTLLQFLSNCLKKTELPNLAFSRLFVTMLISLFCTFSGSVLAQDTTVVDPYGNIPCLTGSYSPSTSTSTIIIDGNPYEWPGVLSNQSYEYKKKAFVNDPFNAIGVDDQWTNGSQDPDLISQWAVVPGNSNDKGDIGNAGAILLNDTLFFCGDRAAYNGDAQIGFWFFKDRVSINADGSFSGIHMNGDLLILSTFTNGGGVGNPNIYTWENGALLQAVSPAALLATNANQIYSPNGQTVNLGSAGVKTWTFYPKNVIAGCKDYLANLFFEGYVVLSSIGDYNVGCYASFLLETRNSQSVNASLQDIVVGSFAGQPDPPMVTNASKCYDNNDQNPLILTATCSNPGHLIKWYSSQSSTTVLTTSAADSISIVGTLLIVAKQGVGTYTYYASCTEDGCEGQRTAATATIWGLPVVSADATPAYADPSLVLYESAPPHYYLSS